MGSNPSVHNSSVWDGGQWRDSVSLARVNPALMGTWRNLGKVNRKGVRKQRMAGAQPPTIFPG